MAINFEPKIGQILECNYGGYQYDENAWLSLEGLKRTSCLSAIPARPFHLESQLLADFCPSPAQKSANCRPWMCLKN